MTTTAKVDLLDKVDQYNFFLAQGAFSRSWTGQKFFLNFLHENGKLPSNTDWIECQL